MTSVSEDGTTTHDFIILGSGGAGLTAALAAHKHGLKPVVFEKSSTFGGTTAVSGGVVWVPNNHHQAKHGVVDSREAAHTYMTRLARGRSCDELIDAYLDHAPAMLRDVESWLDRDFTLIPTYPDYQAELEGALTGGRSLDNALFQTHRLGDHRALLRRNPITGKAPITISEAMKWGVFSKPFDYPIKEVYARYKEGWVHGGNALIGRLMHKLLELNVPLHANAAATRLLTDDDGVTGVLIERDGRVETHHARYGVLIATGGFAWNADLCARFLAGVPAYPATPPSCEGDGLVMAQAVGAKLGNMPEAWWCPTVQIPGETYDDAPLARSEFSVRCLPHSIIVNKRGQRFVNEALNYNDVGKPFWDFDASSYEDANQPAWIIVDGQYLSKYVFVSAIPGRELPEYIARANSLEELADELGIDPIGLRDQVERFNRYAAEGVDPEFRRGDGAFEHFYGDPEHAPNPNLGTIAQGPFAALPLYAGTIGTKGGAQCDAQARVLDLDNIPIPGLYAAGNAAASPMGEGYPGAGATIGSAMTFGWLAAKDAAGAKVRADEQ